MFSHHLQGKSFSIGLRVPKGQRQKGLQVLRFSRGLCFKTGCWALGHFRGLDLVDSKPVIPVVTDLVLQLLPLSVI